MDVRLKDLARSAAFCCGIGFVSPALAASLSSADHDVLVSTAQGATYELAVAKLALTKATRGDIKSYARTMITDHKSLDGKAFETAFVNDETEDNWDRRRHRAEGDRDHRQPAREGVRRIVEAVRHQACEARQDLAAGRAMSA